MTDFVAGLIDPIREGSFPESADLLTAELDSEAVSRLLEDITTARNDLSNDLRNVSKPYAGSVDQWISQAKQVQQDIARCKQEARDIVQEHDRVDQSRRDKIELGNKVRLLENEISFTTELQSYLRRIATADESLRGIDAQVRSGNALDASKRLTEALPALQTLQGPRAQAVVLEYRDDVLKKTRQLLTDRLRSRISITQEKNERILWITNDPDSSNASLFSALIDLDAADTVVDSLVDAIDSAFLQSLSSKSTQRFIGHSHHEQRFVINVSDSPRSDIASVLAASSDMVEYLRSGLPARLYEAVATQLGSRLISTIIGEWLTPSIPVNLDDVGKLDALKQDVLGLVQSLDEKGWPNTQDLKQWTQHAPRMWLAKRKAEALDSVRRAFAASSGLIHQVERVERQKVSSAGPQVEGQTIQEDVQDDWNASWDDQEKDSGRDEGAAPGANDEDDTSGWGFDDDMGEETAASATKPNGNKQADPEDDVDDAWGWNEESAEAPSKETKQRAAEAAQPTNGINDTAVSQELVLVELYSVTDIPDGILESIGRDIQDAVRLQDEQHTSLQQVPASSGLLALPSLSLSMFRATASINYSKHTSLGNMNLYNDALYIADKLQGMSRPSGMKDIEADCAAMERFAKSAYAREMDLHRTILADLLDGVQGFMIPYAEQIEEAISATSDRLRQLHREWAPILSTSALLQSIGALFSSILSKVITDIEEMDDISEAQSQRLSNFCAQLNKLQDLFIATPPGEGGAEQEPVPMVAVYTSNWLRFQYFDQLLSASLVDIKYLWTEGELSLEFSAEEVVDLIKALFSESSHRRNAIAAIKGHRGSGMS